MVAQAVTAVATIAASVSPIRRRMADTSVAPLGVPGARQ